MRFVILLAIMGALAAPVVLYDKYVQPQLTAMQEFYSHTEQTAAWAAGVQNGQQ